MPLLLLLALSTAPDAGVAPVGEPAPGPFTREAVNRIVRKHQAELNACTRSGGGGVELTLSFTVGPDGRVKEITTESINVTDSTDLRECMQGALRSWAFPSPGKRSVNVQHYRLVTPEVR